MNVGTAFLVGVSASLFAALVNVPATAATYSTSLACLALPAGFSTPPVTATAAPASLWRGWTYDHDVTLTATPSTALEDRPIIIRVSGLKPGAPITLHASMKDDQARIWSSSATFVADEQGVVDVARMPPRYGSYAGVHAMGLVWSMLPEGVEYPASKFFSLPVVGTEFHIAALESDQTLASANILRLPWSPLSRNASSIAAAL